MFSGRDSSETVIVKGESMIRDDSQYRYSNNTADSKSAQPMQHHQPLETSNELWALPPGWITARQETDGRMYYYEPSTGRTSWSHPMAPVSNSMQHQQEGPPMGDPWGNPDPNRRMLDTPLNASRRPDSHQVYACLSLLLFFPLGVCAMLHSYKVDRAWQAGRYGDAVNHSRQASRYACFGMVFGIVVLLIWWINRREGGFEWPDFDFDFFDG